MVQLTTLLSNYSVSASVFFNGAFCGANRFAENDQLGQLHLVRSGRVTMHHDDRASICIEEPTLVFYPRGLTHSLVVPQDRSASLLCANISFGGPAQNALSKGLPEVLTIPVRQLDSLAPIFGLLFEEASAAYPGQKLVLDRLCDVLVIHVLRYAFATHQIDQRVLAGFADPGLSRALVAIHDYPAKPWSVDTLAHTSGMSRSKFAQLFHAVVGITPVQYVTEHRMSLAQKLLAKQKPVKIVATEVGYGSQPAFTKAFTAKFGMSPTAWLNSGQ